MVISGKLDSKKHGVKTLAGKPYTFDLGRDVFHVEVLHSDAVYSDYVPFNEWYMVVDFDRNNRVVSYTIEGLLEDYKRKSLRNRFAIDFGLGLAHMKSIASNVVKQAVSSLPSPDGKGK
jgi:hypothetical protein